MPAHLTAELVPPLRFPIADFYVVENLGIEAELYFPGVLLDFKMVIGGERLGWGWFA